MGAAGALGAVLGVLALLALGTTPARASLYGDSLWCAVHDEGAGNIIWDCEFDTVADCTPAILAGNKGFCQHNPYWQPPPPEPPQYSAPPPAPRGK